MDRMGQLRVQNRKLERQYNDSCHQRQLVETTQKSWINHVAKLDKEIQLLKERFVHDSKG